MDVKLLGHSDLYVVALAARMCSGTIDRLSSEGDMLSASDRDVIERRVLAEDDPMSPPHESIIDHLSYTYMIDGFSRAMLQELARHRIASISVESTRYSLKKIIAKIVESGYSGLSDCFVKTGNEDVDTASEMAIQTLIGIHRKSGEKGIKNDVLKFCLVESFKTRAVFTINARSLRNLLVLRSSKRAMWEFRECA
jgi:thymidylate synthase (FAD)